MEAPSIMPAKDKDHCNIGLEYKRISKLQYLHLDIATADFESNPMIKFNIGTNIVPPPIPPAVPSAAPMKPNRAPKIDLQLIIRTYQIYIRILDESYINI